MIRWIPYRFTTYQDARAPSETRRRGLETNILKHFETNILKQIFYEYHPLIYKYPILEIHNINTYPILNT